MLISRSARHKYQFDDDLFQADGGVRLGEYHEARRFAVQMSRRRLQPVPASDVQAMSLLDEALRLLLRQYELQNPGVLRRGLEQLQAGLGGALEPALIRFTDEFPPRAVYYGDISAADHLAGDTAGRSHREAAVENLLIVHVTNQNPAISQYQELFSDEPLKASASYGEMVSRLGTFLGRQPSLGGEAAGGESLLDALLSPARAAPYSLEGQLQYVLDRWGFLLGEGLIRRLLRGMDFIREEVIRHQGPIEFRAPVAAPTYGSSDYAEYERFSPDKDWMPRLVLMAKNSYVWLEQLSRKHQRWIRTLDQIPDEELDLLAQRAPILCWKNQASSR